MFKLLNNLSIQAKLITGLSLILLIGAISGVLVMTSVMRVGSGLSVMEQVSMVKGQFEDLQNHTNEVHVSMVDFVSFGNLERRDDFERGAAKVPAMINELSGVIENHKIKEELVKIENLFNTWLSDVTEKQLNYMRSPTTVDMARLLESSEKNKKLWDDLDSEFKSSITLLTEMANDKSIELKGTMDVTNLSSALSLVFIVATVILVSVFVVFFVSRPLRELVVTTNELVDKNWQISINGEKRNDEIGDMAKALMQFRDNGIENEKLQEQQAQENEKRLERAKNIERMVEEFRGHSSEITQALDAAMLKMTSSSETMSGIADNTNQRSEEVQRAAQMAGSNVQSVATATEEMTASIQEISKQLNMTNGMVSDAKSVSETTVEKMKLLESAATDIGGVIEIISDIAEQTNLLALNATIEAARAGEMGKGFAVVASEVKTLASETAKATEQVQTQIERIQLETGEAVTFIENISKSIENLTHSMGSIASAMEEQTSVTQEIGRNVAEAATGTQQVVDNITDVSKATQKTQETSRGVGDIALELSERSDGLKNSIDEFIRGIQSA